MPRPKEPFLWVLFSGGGMITALCLPVVVLVLWIAAPLGWVDAGSYAAVAPQARHPLGRLFLFTLVSLALFHWAHRFRYTLYDGLQLYHLNRLIAVLTYGVAGVLTMAAAYGVARL